jgi:predicted ribonuclease YlaK
VFDTNLLVSHLDLLKQALETGEWQIVIPLIVINELDGLKVNPPPLGTAAAEAVALVEQSLSSRRLRVVTQQGNGLSNLTFRSQQLLPKNTEDGAGSIDAFIIETVKHQMEHHTGKVTTAERAVLITGDRSMRVIAKARGVAALSGGELRREIFKKPEGQEVPKKKAWS